MGELRKHIETPEMLAKAVEHFSVSPRGELVRLIAVGGKECLRVGAVAGSKHRTGYIHVKFAGHKWPAHRLVFAITNNQWPAEFVDHINGDKSDNRPANLREATGAQNQWNTRARKGVSKGVFYRKDLKKWRARIRAGGKVVTLGFFNTEGEAKDAYDTAAKNLHGEFANAKTRTEQREAPQQQRNKDNE